MGSVIHPTAVISKGAAVGDNVNIGAYCVVDDNVTIGSGTVLRPFVRVCNFTEIGSGCTIYEHAVIGGDPQDLSYKGETTWARLGNNIVCREFVTVNRAVGEGNDTTVGDGCFIMEGVHLAHNVRVGRECTIANKAGLSGHVHIGDYVVIGGMAGFHQFTHVGSYCMVGGMSRIVQDVPPYTMAVGSPLYVYDINKVGLRRRGISSETRRLIREIYKVIYSKGMTIKEGLAEVERLYGDTQAGRMILDFASETLRGFSPRIDRSWQQKQEDKPVD